MSRTTVAGSAPSRINRSLLMHRAWAIFRSTYRYPQIKFSDIGRKCFAWALRRAWAEILEERRLLDLSPVLRHERIATLQALILRADFIDSGPHWKATISAYRDEIRCLQAA
jgi:hypothetical protein